MTAAFGSFGKSPFGAFVKSPLGARGVGIGNFYAGALGTSSYRAAYSPTGLNTSWVYTSATLTQRTRFMLGNIGNKIISGSGYWDDALSVFTNYSLGGSLQELDGTPKQTDASGTYIALGSTTGLSFVFARSTDNGASWSEISLGGTPNLLNCDCIKKSTGRLIIGGADSNKPTIWRSDDNGATWTTKNATASTFTTFNGASVYYKGSTLHLLYRYNSAGSRTRHYTSTDDGDSWSFDVETLPSPSGGPCIVMPSGRVCIFGRKNSGQLFGYTDNDGGSYVFVTTSGASFVDNSYNIWRLKTGSPAVLEKSINEGTSFFTVSNFDSNETQILSLFQKGNYKEQ